VIRALILLIFISAGHAFPDISQSQFLEANDLMHQENYPEASEKYESLLQQGYLHPDLYYNLGNSYFKQAMYGQAIWAYESGLLLSPMNKDLKFNLKLSESRVKDRITQPESFFLLSIYRSIKLRMKIIDGLLFGSLFLLLASITTAFNRFGRINSKLASKGITLFLLFSFISHGIVLDKYWDISNTKEGIIILPACNVYSIPLDRKESILFVLHEGTKGEITQEQDQWVEIELIDGNKGWIESQSIRKL